MGVLPGGEFQERQQRKLLIRPVRRFPRRDFPPSTFPASSLFLSTNLPIRVKAGSCGSPMLTTTAPDEIVCWVSNIDDDNLSPRRPISAPAFLPKPYCTDNDLFTSLAWSAQRASPQRSRGSQIFMAMNNSREGKK